MSGLSKLSPLLIIFLIASVYSHTLSYPWHFDDSPNILQNPAVQIENLSLDSLSQSMSAKPFTGGLSRPFAFLTLAVNWYFGQDNTFGYHLVNIGIHVCTALSLYYCLCLLLKTPALEKRFDPKSRCTISLITTLFWALHPIQIQAVTYIVQRMASLAALFFILAIIFFLKNHFSEKNSTRIKFLFYCFMCFVLGIASKENAVLLPLSLLLVHLTFLKSDTRPFSTYLLYLLTIICVLIVVFASYFLISRGFFESLLSMELYGSRPFSLMERVLTQPRIIVFYLSLIFYPIPTRFSIDHSFELSTSLFDPWTTLPAIFFLISLFSIGVITIRRFPLTSFALLFFLVNHIIESSIIPLELVFEHRNYLPTMFLFLPLSVGFYKLTESYREQRRGIHTTLVIFLILLLTLVGWSTYLRNYKWQSTESLWLDALEKAPSNARAYSYLGKIYGWDKPMSEQNLEKALYYYHQSLDKMGPIKYFDSAILSNIGRLYFNYKRYQEAQNYYEQALNKNDSFARTKYGLAEAFILQEKFEDAEKQLDEIISDPDTINVDKAYNLKGSIYLWKGKNEEATALIGKAIANTNAKIRYYYNMGIALSRSKHYDKADWYFKNVLKDTPGDIAIMLSIIENELRASRKDKAEKYARNLVEVFPEDTIKESLTDQGLERYRSAPIDYQLITPVIEQALLNK